MSAATASAEAPNPPSNLPFSTPPSCGAPTSTACENAAVAELDGARTSLGLPAYGLPADFDSLAPADQIFILSNLDRAAYGLPPVVGLSTGLDAAAALGVAEDADPDPDSDIPAGTAIVGWWSNWAGGYANALLAYYGWMYDDGPGSPNLDCAGAGDPGCWGHRQDILAVSNAAALVMGAAVGTDSYGEPGYALTIVGTAGASTSWTTLNYTWTQALADIAGSGSPPASGAGSGTPLGSGSSGAGSGSSGAGSGNPGASGPSGAGSGSSGAAGSPTGSVPSTGSTGASGSPGQRGRPSGNGSAGGRTHTPTAPSSGKDVAKVPVIAHSSVDASTHAASFVLRASDAASGFQCALVRRSATAATVAGPRYGTCGAVSIYRHLETGSYTFYARAAGSAGSRRATVRRSFSIR